MSTKDIIQENEGDYSLPRARVWIHPHRMGESGSDYFQEFSVDAGDPSIDDAARAVIADAEAYRDDHPGAEETVIVAYDGYEFTPESFWAYRENDDEFPDDAT